MTTSNRNRHHHHHVILGKYELLRLLGRGSFAKVFLARAYSSENAPPVAIKVLDKSKLVAAGLEQRLLHEVAAMHRLSHPNILKLHEVLATKTKIFLVMEYAPGGDLGTRLARRRAPLSEQLARRYFMQLISALEYCHSLGIIHRDIKPQNILLDKDGNLKLCDFGLAALPETLKDGRLQTACGTPAYTAPEVVCRKGYDGVKADLWSCGVVLYVMLVGHLPFDVPDYYSFLQLAIRKRNCKFPSSLAVSNSAKRLVWRLLDANPNTRITLREVLEHNWLKRLCSKSFKHDDLDDIVECNSACMNAFGIISLSSGLDLSGLFDEDNNKRMVRFTSREPVERIVGRIKEIGMKFGCVVEGLKERKVGVNKSAILMVEIVEIALPLQLVELRVKDRNGDRIVGRIKEIGMKFGCVVEGLKERKVGVNKSAILMVEIVEIALPLQLVELRVKDRNGDRFCGEELKNELGDIVCAFV